MAQQSLPPLNTIPRTQTANTEEIKVPSGLPNRFTPISQQGIIGSSRQIRYQENGIKTKAQKLMDKVQTEMSRQSIFNQ